MSYHAKDLHLQEVLDSLISNRQRLVDSGQWQSGDRTLLDAMRVTRDELRLCRALAWLLNPEGHHRMRDAVLRRLFGAIGVEYKMTGPVHVELEAVRYPRRDLARVSRADIVVSSITQRLVIEAKVYAGEQPDQCARLVEAWGGESTVFVFLTLDAHRPTSAGPTRDRWAAVSWSQAGAAILAATEDASDVTGAATSLGLSLLDISQGDSTMHQSDFFLANYRQIRYVSSIGPAAASSLIDGMCVAFDEVLEEAAIEGWSPYRAGLGEQWARYGMQCETGDLAGLIAGFGWTRSKLLSLVDSDAGEVWPYLGLLVTTDVADRGRVLERARSVLKPLIDDFALDEHERSWTAFTYTPAVDVKSVEGYVQELAEQLRRFVMVLARIV